MEHTTVTLGNEKMEVPTYILNAQIAQIIGLMDIMPNEMRLRILHKYCHHCGSIDPECNCNWDLDENGR